MPEEETLIEDDSSEDQSATVATDPEDDGALSETALEPSQETSETVVTEESLVAESGGEAGPDLEKTAGAEAEAEAQTTADTGAEEADAGTLDGEPATLEEEAEAGPDLEKTAGAEAEAEAQTTADTGAEEADAGTLDGEPATLEEEAEEPEQEIPEDAAWYVVHTYSGYENKVKQNLEYRIKSLGMEDRIFRIVVPVEEEVDIKEGQRRVVERRIFPGYVFVQMKMDDDAWYLIHNTPGVTGFVGSGGKPTPLRDEEVERILKRIEAEKPTVRVSFREGQRVRIVDGPFSDFHGIVDEIDMERGKVRLLVSFFGRETPVELDLLQVEKG